MKRRTGINLANPNCGNKAPDMTIVPSFQLPQKWATK